MFVGYNYIYIYNSTLPESQLKVKHYIPCSSLFYCINPARPHLPEIWNKFHTQQMNTSQDGSEEKQSKGFGFEGWVVRGQGRGG